MKEPRQIPLDLGASPSFRQSDFLIAPCNRTAHDLVMRWPAWPSTALVVIGAPGAGKTHLAKLWAVRSGAVELAATDLGSIDPARIAGAKACLIEGADAAVGAPEAERTLFHLYNLLAGSGGSLLLTAGEAPARWSIGLPDLASRLKAATVVEILAPDEDTLAAVLVKLFSDRQLIVPAEVLTYLLSRMERSFEAAVRIVDRIDRDALARRSPVTLPLVRAILLREGDAEEQDTHRDEG